MPRNGTGTYVLPAGQPVVPGTTISSSVFNTLANDIATALTSSIAVDGQSPMSANLPMGNFKITGLANGTAAGDAVNFGQISGSSGSASLGFIQTGTGAAARTVQSKLRDVINVKDYGAVGDGVADDTAAIRNALQQNHGRLVWFPAGTYNVTSNIAIGSGVAPSMRGEGKGQTIIRAVAPLSINNTSMIDYLAAVGFEVSNITFDFNNRPNVVGNEAVIGALNCTLFSIHDCEVLHLTSVGIATNGARQYEIARNFISKDVAANTLNQAILGSASAQQQRDCQINDNICENTAILVNCLRGTLRGNHIYAWKFGGGIALANDATNCGYLHVIDNTIHDGVGTDVNATNMNGIENWSQFATIADNIIYGTSGDGIAQFGPYCNVHNNICFNNGTVSGNGITSGYLNSTSNSRGSVYTGNKCFDSQVTHTQQYGFADSSSLSGVAGITVVGNDFNGTNLLGACNIQSTNGNYQTPCNETALAVGSQLITNGGSFSWAVTVSGASLGDFGVGSHSSDLQGCSISAYVSTANTMIVVVTNNTGSNKTIAAGNVRAKYFKIKNFSQY